MYKYWCHKSEALKTIVKKTLIDDKLNVTLVFRAHVFYIFPGTCTETKLIIHLLNSGILFEK